MKRQRSIRLRLSFQLLAVPVVMAGVLLNSLYAVAGDPIPFKSMMQSASSQIAVPPVQAANGASVQPVRTDHVTNAGKGMIVGGFVLLTAGVFTVALTAALASGGFRPSGAKEGAAYGVGASAAAGGVTLIAFGFHRRSSR